MLFKPAAVHHEEPSCFFRTICSCLVDDTLLQPNRLDALAVRHFDNNGSTSSDFLKIFMRPIVPGTCASEGKAGSQYLIPQD